MTYYNKRHVRSRSSHQIFHLFIPKILNFFPKHCLIWIGFPFLDVWTNWLLFHRMSEHKWSRKRSRKPQVIRLFIHVYHSFKSYNRFIPQILYSLQIFSFYAYRLTKRFQSYYKFWFKQQILRLVAWGDLSVQIPLDLNICAVKALRTSLKEII